MDRFSALRLFKRVVETASFSQAAKSEGVRQSTVSKQVAALEARLGNQLLRRTSRGINVTDAGREFYEAVVRILGELEEAESRAAPDRAPPRGHLKVAVSAGLARMYIVPRLPEFFARYPDISLDFDVSDRYVNLVEGGIDVAVRIGHLRDSSLVARRIGSVQTATVATPAYLQQHGEPRRPAELKKHACVSYLFHGSPRQWDFRTAKGVLTIAPTGLLRTNDAEHVRAGILAGLGIGHCPTWLVADELASGAVVKLLTGHAPLPYPIHALWIGHRKMAGKAKVFGDFLASIFESNPQLRIH